MAGRKAKPTALKVIEGNRGKRALNAQEPVFTNGLGSPPKCLSERGVELWHEIAEQWAINSLAKRAFRPLLTKICVSICEWEGALEVVNKEGRYYFDEKGDPKRHPAVKDLQSYTTIVRSLLSECGLTPSAASRIVAPIAEDDDPLSALGISA